MAQASEAVLAGLPDRARRLLAEPPAMQKRLIELSVAWPSLAGGLARMADAARLFVITWDQLAGRVHRPSGFATTNGAGADLEIVVYLPTWSLVRTATARNSTVAGVMAALAGSAIVTASRYENAVNAGRYPDLAARGEVPDLLSDPAAGSALGAADITALSISGRRAEWEPMGLGAITDLAQHAFGPVDLDRSPVELAAVAATHPRCPACAGGRFGFPGELAESRATMCPTHRRQAVLEHPRRPQPGEGIAPGGHRDAPFGDAAAGVTFQDLLETGNRRGEFERVQERHRMIELCTNRSRT